MHEQALAEGIVRWAIEAALGRGGSRVKLLEIRYALGHVDPDSLRMLLEAAALGTPAEGAELRLEGFLTRHTCLACGKEFQAPRQGSPECPRCSSPALAADARPEVYLEALEYE